MNIRKLINRLPDSVLNARLVCWLFPQFNQTWNDQPQTLAKLARATAKPGWTALEVGSWAGHSSVILGAVAKEAGGRLVCVDWWRGAGEGDRNAIVSSQRDVYRVFWQRVTDHGLADTVVPMRGRSDAVMPFLAGQRFDFIFIDGDHRYEGVKHDIAQAKRLIKPGGTICGHDCEIKPTPDQIPFMRANKDVDAVDKVHCGTVLAVWEAFTDYEIDNGIWVARATDVNRADRREGAL